MMTITHRTRLALTYLTIIMVLSVGFSYIFYHEATQAANTGFIRQASQLRNNLYFASPDVLQRIRDEGINKFNDNVLARLFLLNLFMLLAGGALSFYLARLSLEPLEESLEAQSRFTSDAAHELRTPLTVMKTEAEIALRAKNITTAEAKDILGSNLEEISKLQALTDALLRLAKNNSADSSDWKQVKITEVLNVAAERVEQQAKKRKIEFKLPSPSSVVVRGDKDQLAELFVILFDNAIKYGNDKTSVEVTALKNDSNIVIAVTDQGIGIDSKDLPHVFERFYRADQSRTKTNTDGYGLGLSVAEAIARSHGGTIAAASKAGEGTTFTVTLPRK